MRFDRVWSFHDQIVQFIFRENGGDIRHNADSVYKPELKPEVRLHNSFRTDENRGYIN